MVGLVVSLVVPAGPVRAQVAGGSLVKTNGNSAVYWFGTDGKRHAFPSAAVFYTWFADFNSVRTVTATELAAMPLGANVRYRAGTRLIKLTTDPKVYAVEPDGALRWVASENAAQRLYGNGWGKRIDDVPDTFFMDYRVTTELDGTRAPAGAIVRGTDGALSIVTTTGRQPLSDAAATFLGKFAVADSGWLANLAAGAALTAAPVPFGDPVVTYAATPTFTFVPTVSNFASPGRNVQMGIIQLSTSQALQIRRLGLRMDSLHNESGDSTTDADFGGLVYGNNVRANFMNLRLVDAAGVAVFGSHNLHALMGEDATQNITWEGDWRVPAKSQVTLALVADVNGDIPHGETYQVSFLPEVADVRDAAAERLTILPTAAIKDDIKVVMDTTLGISFAAGTTRTVRGENGVTMLKMTVAAGSLDTTLSSLAVKGYLNTNGSNSYFEGGNIDGGVQVRVSDVITKVSLYEGDTRLAGPVTVDLNGRAAFSGMNALLRAGTSHELKIVGDVSKTVTMGGSLDLVAFDLVDAASQVTATDSMGVRANVNVAGQNLVSGQPRQYVRVAANGTLRAKWQATGNEVIAGETVSVGTMSFTAVDEGFSVDTLTFRQDGAAVRSFPAMRLDYPGRDGKTISKRVTWSGNVNLQLSSLGLFVPANKTVTATLYAETLPFAAGAAYEENLRMRLALSGPIQFTADATGTVRNESMFGAKSSDDFFFEDGQPNSIVIRFSTMTVLKDGDPLNSEVSRAGNVEVLRAAWKAVGPGRVRIRKVAFRVAPGDAGREGTDAIEYWVSKVGSLDANDIIELVRVDPNGNETVIGEDALTSLRLTICGSGGCLERGSGYVSRSSDYAVFTYDFRQGAEFPLSSGETTHLRLKLDTSGFWKDPVSYKNGLIPLTVSLPGYSDFLWTDSPNPTYEVRAATKGDLPVSATVQVELP
jgi:hypothetical protein